MENFCNHIDPLELEFGMGKLLMVTGPNGSGKTSMFQALPYTLYGVCEKGRGEDVLNDKVKKNCHVWTEFATIEGDEVNQYRVDRYVKYTKKGNTVILEKNGIPIAKGHKEVVPEIEKIIVPYKLFTNTLLFGQKVKTFFTDLNDSEQKEIFRKILTLQKYVTYQQQANTLLKDLDDDLQGVINQILLKQGLIESGNTELQRLYKERKDFYILKDQAVKELQLNLTPLSEKLSKSRLLVLEYNSKNLDSLLEELNTQLGSLTEKFDNMESELTKAEKEIVSQKTIKESELNASASEARIKASKSIDIKKQEVSNRYTEELIELDDTHRIRREEIVGITASMNNITNTIKNLNLRIEDLGVDPELEVCPTCHQDIAEDCINKLNERIKLINNEITELRNKNAKLIDLKKLKEQELGIIKLKHSKLADEIVDEKAVLDTELINKNKEIQERLTTACSKLQNMAQTGINSARQANKEERENISTQIEVLKKEKTKLEVEINSRELAKTNLTYLQIESTKLNEKIQAKLEEEYNESTIDSIKNKGKRYLEEKLRLNELKISYENRHEMLKFWSTGFSSSGIQSMLIDDSIPFMNRRIAEYMDKLSNGRYSVTFDTMKATKAGDFRDKISVEVFDNVTHADSRVKISGGQERIVDIGTILTLSDLQTNIQNVEFNIMLFDEIFDALDDENVGLVSKLIRQVAKNKWIGVISHRHIDNVESDEVLSFQ